MTPAELLRAFVDAFQAGDGDRMRSLLDPGLVSSVTNGTGGADRLDGAEAYIARLPDLAEATLALRITQALPIGDDRVLAMVEVRAHRRGRDLHNHAGFLARAAGGRIAELWMVDALPAESDDFWR